MSTLSAVPHGPSLHVDPLRWPDLAPVRANVARAVRARIAAVLFDRAVSSVAVRVSYPGGRVVGGGGPDSPLMQLSRPRAFFDRLGSDGLIGFGESYMAGDWDAEDLGSFLTELCRRLATLIPAPLQTLRTAYVSRRPGIEKNTVTQTQGNIARHYDLSNDLFALFLDETMTYSAALFEPATLPPGERSTAELAAAQGAKIDRLLDGASVGPGSRVLEIGTGWGELAIRAARRGATVRSVTLSEEQQALARQRVEEAGFAGRVAVDLLDYRQVDGQYDAIVSVEMIEAVGHEYWPTYFATIDTLLAPGGRVAIQAITMPHDRMLATKETWTWVHKYIFPGGFLPSTEAIEQVTREHTQLRVRERLSMGLHYAETLRLWDEGFLAAREQVLALGFDDIFTRMWHFYLEYSRAGFASAYLDVQQLVFSRDGAV